MSSGSCLSDKALCRFRTKPCERLLATGSCSFQDKCQYSHDDWLRRNPQKVAYEPVLCPKLHSCQAGRKCEFAHSHEEVQYHPRRYKVSRCFPSLCRGYYCPYAHFAHERRNPQAVTMNSPTPSPDNEDEEVPSDVLPFDEMLRLDATEWRTKRGTEAQLPGSVKLRTGEWRRCCVRLKSYTREERAEVDLLMRELKVWMRVYPKAALAVRRSVASVALALKEEASPTTPAGAQQPGRAQAKALLRQVAADLSKLHGGGVAHTCLNPLSVTVEKNSRFTFRLADFLPKLRTLMALKRGWSEKDGDFSEWAVWHPPEVQEASRKTPQPGTGSPGSTGAAQALGVDLFAVDAWQLGAVAATALLGGHPFGDSPDDICKNIARNMPVRLEAAGDADLELITLLRKLLDPSPEKRPRLEAVSSDAALCEVQAVPSESSSCASDEAFEVGAMVSCSWEGGVRLRPRRVRALRSARRLEKGDSDRICNRRGGWIQLEGGGWAPLRGIGEAAGHHLFEEVAESSSVSVAAMTDTLTEPRTPPPHETTDPGPACCPPKSNLWTQTEWSAFWAGYRDASDASQVELKLPAPPTPGIPRLPAKVNLLCSNVKCELLATDDGRFWIQEGFVWL